VLLTELPLGLPGRVFAGPMPFSRYDPDGAVLDAVRAEGVSLVVVLAERDECPVAGGRELFEHYRAAGLEVLHVPVRDFTAPDPAVLAPAVARVLAHARAGGHAAVHCHAGRGRTGLFAACLGRAALGLDGDDAIAWVRRLIPGAVETAAQQALVRAWR